MLTLIGFIMPKKPWQPTHEKETTLTDNELDKPKYRETLLVYSLLHYFNGERSALRVEELDGVSGPCSGCASDFFTGYTQGIMGSSLAYSGGENIFSLNELVIILYTTLSIFIAPQRFHRVQSLKEILDIIVENSDKLPDRNILSKNICGEENLIDIDNRLIDSLVNHINKILNNNYDNNIDVLKKVSESIVITSLIHNEAFTPRGLQCPARITGELKILKGTSTKELPILEVKITRNNLVGTER